MAPEPDAGAAAPTAEPIASEAPTAPPVVAVVVARDPGPWFGESLRALADQSYPELAVLVIDVDSREDVRSLVAEILPDAYVRRLDHNPGYGAAANEVLEVVEGAPFFLFLHDDVALAPDAVRKLVEEAFRSNAGLVGPKLVPWDGDGVLLQVGLTVDKTGFPMGLVDRGELDQEQHDSVRDVFALPGGCLLVRSDLFAAVGGFDPDISFLGDDVDLCWRAQVVGARVVVAPDAVGRHLEALAERRDIDDRRRLQARHRLRTVLKTYGVLHLLRVLPQALVVTVIELLVALLIGRWGHARDVAGAWTWNVRHRRSLIRQRRALQRARQVPDFEIRRLQMRGSARVRAFTRGQLGVEERARLMAAAGRELSSTLASRRARLVLFGMATLAVVVVVGSRELVAGDLPAIGGFQPIPPPSELAETWWNGWRDVGVGTDSPPPTGLILYAIGGAALFGAMGALQHLLVVGALVMGLVGAWALGRRLGSVSGAAGTAAAYAALPLGYNAVANGSWSGLVAWAAAPWILRRLAQATGDQPFVGLPARVVTFGIGLALIGALVPFVVALPVLAAVGLALGGAVVGRTAGALRALGFALGGALLAAVLNLPWTLDFLPPGAEWAAFGGVEEAGRSATPLADLLRFTVGPVGFDNLGWAVPIAAFLPLLVVRDWRLAWAGRAWGGALVPIGLAWAAERGWLPIGVPDTEVLLAPAAAALALAVGCGSLAFERELTAYRFGWRQAVTALAGLALVAGVIPLVPAATSGRWRQPAFGVSATLGFIDEEAGPDEAGFRVLWMGHPAVLPVGAWELVDGLGYGTSTNGMPDITQQWPGSTGGPTGLVGDSLRVALAGDTAELGRLIAPLGIRYLVAMEEAAPGHGGPTRPVPEELEAALGQQVDLRSVDAGPGLVMYENAAWQGEALRLPPGAAEALGVSRLAAALSPEVREVMDAAAPLALRRESPHELVGSLPEPGPVLVAHGADDDWRMEVDGEEVPRQTALGSVDLFQAPVAGDVRIAHRPPATRHLGVALQVLLWAVVLVVAWRGRARSEPA